uniref:8 kDa Amblyomma family member n=1 Tax=Rhipicephalus appendiculatus TaxID=34631 RepID=A0A131YHY2_RHIAP
MPVRALKRKKWRDTLPMLQLLLPALPHNAALCPMSHVVCNDAVLVYLNTNKLKQGRGSLLTRTLALKTTFFYFFSSAVTFSNGELENQLNYINFRILFSNMSLVFLILTVIVTNEISAWPGPPSGHGIMRYCGNSKIWTNCQHNHKTAAYIV